VATKINTRQVRLASTGKHLFDAPYCYRHRFEIDGIAIEYVNRAFLASAELTDDQKARLIKAIADANEAQEREWGVNQPSDDRPRDSMGHRWDGNSVTCSRCGCNFDEEHAMKPCAGSKSSTPA